MSTIDHLFAAFSSPEDAPKKARKTESSGEVCDNEYVLNCGGNVGVANDKGVGNFFNQRYNANVIFEDISSAPNCSHKCVRPVNWECKVPDLTAPPAKTYPYELDAFQTEAISCLECDESVLVSAHTSAGKTTIAEYAVAMAMRDKQRVIYTSPIKALSNQKYRDFSDEFGANVGLLTGDVTINPTASFLIMTTEILRSMLYRGSEVCGEVKWIIFDEVHYMRDRERGVVWEETMILLPDSVRFVFLSATIPNSVEFSEWICRIKNQSCHLIYTETRPVPLQHYVFPTGGDGIYLVIDENGKFMQENFSKAIDSMENGAANSNHGLSGNNRKKQSAAKNHDLLKVIRMCTDRMYLPVIVFAFSKTECEQNAVVLLSTDFVTDDEKLVIDEVFMNAMSMLADEDKDIPQIKSMLGFLRRGIGIHHGGLLPILKETVELLFGENLIKVLFCTETFSMGINMPAKTVVFTAMRKWDGVESRNLNCGEYIQMAGRAGRRGKDEQGLCILILSDKMEQTEVTKMVMGESNRIDSMFFISYSMLLNMIRLEGGQPDHLLERSFRQFQENKTRLIAKEYIGSLEARLDKIGTDLSESLCSVPEENQESVKEILASNFQYTRQINLNKEIVRSALHDQQTAGPFLNPGRMIVAELDDLDAGGNPQKFDDRRAIGKNLTKRAKRDQVMVLRFSSGIPGTHDMKTTKSVPKIDCLDRSGTIHSLELNRLVSISGIRAQFPDCANLIIKEIDNHNSSSASTTAAKNKCTDIIVSIINHEKFNVKGLPVLTPKELNLGEDVERVAKEIEVLNEKIQENVLAKMIPDDATLEIVTSHFNDRVEILGELTRKKNDFSCTDVLVLSDELRSMKRVLRTLSFIDHENVVQQKGRMACEISSTDEVLITECVFNNIFEGMSPEQIAATCSCLIFDEKSDDCPPIADPTIEKAVTIIRGIASNVSQVMAACEIKGIDVSTYVEDRVKPHLVNSVAMWMEGKSFASVMANVDLYEGSFVRVVRRLEELLRELALAARIIGHDDLQNKMSEARIKLRRGIVFTASLYL